MRISLLDDEIEKIEVFDPLTGRVLHPMARFTVYPSSHYVTPRETTLRAVEAIKAELRERIQFFQDAGRLVAKAIASGFFKRKHTEKAIREQQKARALLVESS